MEKNITLRPSGLGLDTACAAGRHTPSIQPSAIHAILQALRTACCGTKKAAAYPLEWLRQYYSGVLHKDVSTRLTLRLLHAQTAFVMAVFPSYDSLAVHVAAAVWLVWAASRCRS